MHDNYYIACDFSGRAARYAGDGDSSDWRRGIYSSLRRRRSRRGRALTHVSTLQSSRSTSRYDTILNVYSAFESCHRSRLNLPHCVIIRKKSNGKKLKIRNRKISDLMVKKVRGEVLPSSLPSVGPRDDPGVQAVSPQVGCMRCNRILFDIYATCINNFTFVYNSKIYRKKIHAVSYPYWIPVIHFFCCLHSGMLIESRATIACCFNDRKCPRPPLAPTYFGTTISDIRVLVWSVYFSALSDLSVASFPSNILPVTTLRRPHASSDFHKHSFAVSAPATAGTKYVLPSVNLAPAELLLKHISSTPLTRYATDGYRSASPIHSSVTYGAN